MSESSQPGESKGATRRGFLKTTAAAITAAGAASVLAAMKPGVAHAEDAPAPAPAATPPPPINPAAGTMDVPVAKADVKGFLAGPIPKGTVLAPGRAIGANDRILLPLSGCGAPGAR